MSFIIHAFILSFQITCIHALFMEGMLLGKFREILATWLDGFIFWFFAKSVLIPYNWKFPSWKRAYALSQHIQKPLWGCVICMASVWTIILTRFDHHAIHWLKPIDFPLMFTVCGINCIIDKIVNYEPVIRN